MAVAVIVVVVMMVVPVMIMRMVMARPRPVRSIVRVGTALGLERRFDPRHCRA
jgi:hypothetical protein